MEVDAVNHFEFFSKIIYRDWIKRYKGELASEYVRGNDLELLPKEWFEDEDFVERFDKTNDIISVYSRNQFTGEYDTTTESFNDRISRFIDSSTQSAISEIKNRFKEFNSLETLKYQTSLLIKEIDALLLAATTRTFTSVTIEFIPKVQEGLTKIKSFILDFVASVNNSVAYSKLPDKKKVEPRHLNFIKYNKIAGRSKKLIKLYRNLKSSGFIVDETDKTDAFDKFFSGEEAKPPIDRISWGDQRALKYFIERLKKIKLTSPAANKGNPAFTLPKFKWVLVQKCFANSEGTDFVFISQDKSARLAKDQKEKINDILADFGIIDQAN